MKELILGRLIDRSAPGRRQYALRCPCCGLEWIGTPIPRSAGDDGRAAAAEEASEEFAVCSLCGSVVCSGCMAAEGELHMCRSCAARIK